MLIFVSLDQIAFEVCAVEHRTKKSNVRKTVSKNRRIELLRRLASAIECSSCKCEGTSLVMLGFDRPPGLSSNSP